MNAQTMTVKSGNDSMLLKDVDGNDLEPSAIEHLTANHFLVADDKGSNLYIVRKGVEKVVQTLEIKGFAIKKPKWEALSFDGEFYYLIGSHAVKLDGDPADKLTKKLADRSHLLRFKLRKSGESPEKYEIDSFIELNITDSLKVAGLYDADPYKNKVKIEGMSIRKVGEKVELVLAFREPSDYMRVYSGELPGEPKSGDALSLSPLFSFEAGKIGTIPFRLSSIEYAPQWKGFFIMTSTEDAETNSFSGNALWFADDESISVAATAKKQIKPRILSLFEIEMKAEGLCLLPATDKNKLNLAIVFDNDFEDTKLPGKIQFFEVSRKIN